ncbi:reverse transcriptase domain-containing protein [Tanacetum coccineum]|uniref:Reverse transcriptase domain-containing protein n=1 Tax=Tanacetum coccineum TaxID=301880 RepID=A0ABQ4ZS42_9ASTR
MSNVLIPKNKVKGVTTRGGKMTSEASHSKKINETGFNKNEPPIFEQDVQEKPHDDGAENKSLSILERASHPLNLKQLDINIPFIESLLQIPKYAKYLKSLLTNKSRLDEACTETMNERCSAVNELPSKEKDPKNFTIPCQVLEKHKEAEDLAADHLSRFESPHMEVLPEREIADKFSDEHLMVLKAKFKDDEPWYADFVSYIVGKVVPPNWTFKKRKRFFSQVKTYFWEEPYAFKLCADNIMRRCVAGSETLKILAHCHSGPTGGHHSDNITAKKVYESGFIGLVSLKMLMIAVDYVSKWVEAQALPKNDACVVVKFLRQLFARFGVPKALISDRGTYFCNSQLEKALQRYGVTHKLSTTYHPQSNGQTEVTNRVIKHILERSVGYNPKGCESRLMQLNKLAELRDGAYENTRIYKEQTKKWHDSRLRGDKDFKSGPNIVKTVYPHGAIDITDKDGFSFKVNGQRLKKYYEGNIDKEDDAVIELENGATRS